MNTYLAPAKLNLFLHVTGRRADGYHLIQSAMRLIDLADTITVEPTGDGRVSRATDVAGVPEDDDLAIRAARLLQQASGSPRGAVIGVEKRIPMGGGLGGGSSDAATVLLALNRLWDLGWSRTRLMDLGVTLGADVPFFIFGESAFVEGIGERMAPLVLPASDYVVVHPGVAVPTAVIFGAPELTRDTGALKISDFSEVGSDVLRAVDTRARNDLEAVAASRFKAVRDALDWLAGIASPGVDRAGACGPARMSGSGACVFRRFVDRQHAQDCVAALPGGWDGWAVRSLDAHPHRDLASD